TTSSRRWERDGVMRTVWLMWRLRLAYALGADACALAHRYYPRRQQLQRRRGEDTRAAHASPPAPS
ncbi:MAG: hypothetical protein ACR2RL_22355, partial [Gammaproteobacteria bacterium]